MNKSLSWLLGHAANVAYPGRTDTSLPILLFHRVLAHPDPLQPEVPDVATMARQFEVLAEVFKVLPLDEAIVRLRNGTLPPRAISITFDDGYRDNYELALPLLRRNGLTATVFVATGFLDGGMMFNDMIVEAVRRMPTTSLHLEHWGIERCEISDMASRVDAINRIIRGIKHSDPERRDAFCEELATLVDEPLPDDLMMTSDHVRSLVAEGMSIGGHTVTHPILKQIDHATARAEIVANRAALTNLIGEPPSCFAYPNGKPGQDYTDAHVSLVRDAGYDCAFSTAWGIPSPKADLYQLPRFGPRETRPVELVSRMVRMIRHADRGGLVARHS